MKLRYLLLLPLLLNGCKENDNGLKTICPLGAPSLLYYDQGNNNNVLFQSDGTQIVAQFQAKQYDAIIIDAMNGLEQIRLHSDTPYRFLKLLTSGNLYLLSYKYDIEPDNNKTLEAFGNTKSVPHLVCEKLNEKWGVKNIEYKDNVSKVLLDAVNDVNKYDYFILAEPALSTLINKKPNVKKIWSIKSLLGSDIPQASLFININKKEEFKNYMTQLNNRIDIAIDKPEIVKDELDKYSKDPSDIGIKFGFPSSDIVYKIQIGEGGSKTKNGFAIYPKETKYTYENINNFLDLINYDLSIRYSKDYFIDL